MPKLCQSFISNNKSLCNDLGAGWCPKKKPAIVTGNCALTNVEVLGTKLGSYVRVGCALNDGVISSAPQRLSFAYHFYQQGLVPELNGGFLEFCLVWVHGRLAKWEFPTCHLSSSRLWLSYPWSPENSLIVWAVLWFGLWEANYFGKVYLEDSRFSFYIMLFLLYANKLIRTKTLF